MTPPLVTADWLADHLDEVVVVDVRWYLDGRSGRDAYDKGHIPGAVFADLDTDLSAPPAPPGAPGGRHPLPSPAGFAAAMSALGIGDGVTVVAYDDAAGMVAARLWWMLDSLGEAAAVLDGGIQAWTGPLDTVAPPPGVADFSARPWPVERFVTADEVAARPPQAVLIDARSPERYAGVENAIDARFGHVPGARNMAFSDNVDPATGRFRDPGWLAQRFSRAGIHPSTEVIACCGSGVSACSDLLALRVAGHAGSKLYVGSWSEWGADPDRPIETGSDQG